MRVIEKTKTLYQQIANLEEYTFTTGLSAPFSSSLSWMYCNINRIILMIAMINEPNAKVPV